MSQLGEQIQTDDWKTEKHVPVIDCPDQAPPGEFFDVKVSLGKAIDHPNTTEHHIRWIKLYFRPDQTQTTYEVGNFQFSAHGEAVKGANEGPVYTDHTVTASMRMTEPGTLHALAYCNIHGLWESSKQVGLA